MATVLHKIKAWLYDNLLTQDNPNDYIARVISERSLNVNDICESAVARGGADVSAAAMEHAVNLFLKEMGYRLCDGFSINTGWFTASVHIRGVFDNPNEKFDPQKHTVLFEFHQGATLRKELEMVGVDILGIAETGVAVAHVTDVKTGSINDILTPNRNLKIAGHKIKIEGADEVNGVYFINTDTQERTKVDASDIVVNNPSELIVIIPQLAAGTYSLEVTTQFISGGGKVLKEPRSTVFDKTLTVQ
ncbi:MAG: DUF4469 domain-containing protein [Prevotellaceae bacterium]|jgi:hypothetical protein|nr:DUF4469 domain-containing protein [Prevotellaceae bacterium]